jgi:hypothetical protein
VTTAPCRGPSHLNPYGRFELDMNSHLALAAAASMVPGPRTVPETEAARSAADGGAGRHPEDPPGVAPGRLDR